MYFFGLSLAVLSSWYWGSHPLCRRLTVIHVVAGAVAFWHGRPNEGLSHSSSASFVCRYSSAYVMPRLQGLRTSQTRVSSSLSLVSPLKARRCVSASLSSAGTPSYQPWRAGLQLYIDRLQRANPGELKLSNESSLILSAHFQNAALNVYATSIYITRDVIANVKVDSEQSSATVR